MQRQTRNSGDRRRGENIAEDGQEKTRPEMFEDFAELQIQAALKQYQDERKRAEAMSSATKNIRVDPMQHGTDENTRSHQNNNVGDPRKSHETIGGER